MGVIVFNGVSSKDLDIRVAKPPEYQIPERDISTTLVPGRNGEALLYVGAFKNVIRDYDVSFPAEIPFSERAATIARWLFSSYGYARLYDDYDPEVYRMAYCQNPGNITSLYQEAGTLTISFVCRPQRFLLSGEIPFELESQGVLYNPTGMEAEPLLDVYGSGEGSITIGDKTIEILSLEDGQVTIDCERENAYFGAVNKNSTVSVQNGFPKLHQGQTAVSWTENITKIQITPRWWSL